MLKRSISLIACYAASTSNKAVIIEVIRKKTGNSFFVRSQQRNTGMIEKENCGIKAHVRISDFLSFLSLLSLYRYLAIWREKRARGVHRTRTISVYKRIGIHYAANFSRIETRFFFSIVAMRFITALKHCPQPPFFVFVKHPEVCTSIHSEEKIWSHNTYYQ